jgi:hypothetical protein
MATGITHENTASPRFVGKEETSCEVQCKSCSRRERDLEALINEKKKSLPEIISILKEELKYHSATAQEWKTINHERKLHIADDWETKSTKGKKGSSEGKMKIRNNEETESKNETVEMRNRFSALETDDEIQTSEQKKNKYENLSRIITSMPKRNTNQNKQECINTASPQKELQTREEMRPNLQSNSTTPRQHNTKGTNETYKIPTIINGRVHTMGGFRQDSSQKVNIITGQEIKYRKTVYHTNP